MTNNSLVFIDSGMGGLSTLSALLQKDRFNIIYFADTKFAPYGKKSKHQLVKRLTYVIDYLIEKYHPIGFVLACNTATTTTISKLRKLFPNYVFIGTEPAINLAIKNKFHSISIIATNATTKSLIHSKKYAKTNIDLNYIPLKCFATEIEQFMLNKNLYSYYKVIKTIYYIKNSTKFCECVVLGCTHYVLIKDLITRAIKCPILDGNKGVSDNIIKNFKNLLAQKNNVTFVISSNKPHLKENYKKILKQILANSTKLC